MLCPTQEYKPKPILAEERILAEAVQKKSKPTQFRSAAKAHRASTTQKCKPKPILANSRPHPNSHGKFQNQTQFPSKRRLKNRQPSPNQNAKQSQFLAPGDASKAVQGNFKNQT